METSSVTMSLVHMAIYPIGIASCLLLLAAVGEVVCPGYTPRVLCDVLSKVLDFYLRLRFPIKHQSGAADLPSCPYRWPNGQGDEGKFLSGIENSALWKEKYGQIYRLWSGWTPEVVLTQPHQLPKAFSDSDKHSKAAANNSGAYMDRLLGKCVGLISGQEWRRLRSVMEVPFGYQVSSARTARIARLVQRHFDQLNENKAGRLRQDERLHPAEDMKMLPFWVVCDIFYGELPAALTQELRELAPLREKLFRHVIQGGLPRFSWARWLPTAANRELGVFLRRWKAFNDAAHAHAVAQEDGSSTRPIVDMYAAAKSGHITEDQLLQTLDEALYANLDVTTGALSWNLVFLAANPAVQERLRAEVQLVWGQSQSQSQSQSQAQGETQAQGQAMEKYICSDSTYLAACVLESSRLKPLAAFSVPQAAPTAREIDGYVIPAGTNFVVDSYALNMHSDTWAPDNTTYRPDRFLARRGAELRYRFWRFGFGPRQCMGKYVADVLIRQTLAHLVMGYQLGWADKEDWRRNGDVWITHPDFELRCTKRA